MKGVNLWNTEKCQIQMNFIILEFQEWDGGIRKYQNKDGSLTKDGQKKVKAYNSSEYLRKKKVQEGNKLIKSDKRLVKDFVNYDQIDDDEYLDLTAREYGINTDSFWKATDTYSKFCRDNSESISTGQKITEKLLHH